MASSDAEPSGFPGFGLEVEDMPAESFPHAIESNLSQGITLRERRMMDFINTISDKPEWERKVFDETIVGKWEEEAKNMPNVDYNGVSDLYMSKKMFRNCIAELRDKAKRFSETGLIDVLDAELTVVKSDTAVSAQLDAKLRESAKILEDVPEAAKDWHPRSNGLVLDLLHPSLFPVVYGRTKVLLQEQGKRGLPRDRCAEFIGKGEMVKEHWSTDSNYGNFQWLPSDVELTDSGAKIVGYVNNLHPVEHAALYPVLENFVDAAVPLWEECLSWFKDRRRISFEDANDEDDYVMPIHIRYERPAGQEGIEDREAMEFDPEDRETWTDHFYDWFHEHRVLTFPDPGEFVPFAQQVNMDERVNLRSGGKFGGRLQVIFKLANIYLTPEKPGYRGGTWHVEGQLNERICASAIYYYDQENVTPSHLAFRQGLDAEELSMIPAQNEHTSLERYLGIEQDGVAIQKLGNVLTRPGRLLAFPNALQHQVQPFTLEDKSKPGHRKILAMFLIDPNRRVLSTSNVPPQRKDWWAPEVRKVPRFARLPLEIFEQIIDAVDDFPISWDDALKLREQLMDERSHMNDELQANMEEERFSFCEH